MGLPDEKPSLRNVLKELGIDKLPVEAKVEVLSKHVESGVVARGRAQSIKEILTLSERLYREEE